MWILPILWFIAFAVLVKETCTNKNKDKQSKEIKPIPKKQEESQLD
jgi:hypothetical protein